MYVAEGRHPDSVNANSQLTLFLSLCTPRLSILAGVVSELSWQGEN